MMVKRYELASAFHAFRECKDGDWVESKDYDILLEKYEELLLFIIRMNSKFEELASLIP